MRKALLLLTSLLPSGACAAADTYAGADFAPKGWTPFLSELFRSLDAVDFALLIFLVALLGMCLDLVNHLRIGKLIPENLLVAVQEEMANGEYERALDLSEKSDCLIGQVFAAALGKTDYSFERMEQAMRDEVEIQGMVWRQWVHQLRTAAWAGLLLGVMGAAVNAMRLVADLAGRPNIGLALSSSFETRSFAHGVFTSLFMGALMALAAMVAHSLCATKLDKILLETKRLGEELLDPFRPLPLMQED